MTFLKRVSIMAIIGFLMVSPIASAQSNVLAQETIKVRVHVPPMQQLEITGANNSFFYEGKSLELNGVIEVNVKTNVPWVLEAQAVALPGGVVPHIKPQETSDDFRETVQISGNQLGNYTLAFDALIPASTNLAPGQYYLDIMFQLTAI